MSYFIALSNRLAGALLALVLTSLWSPAIAQTLQSGGSVSGLILVAGQKNSYGFAANVGEFIHVRAGRTSGTFKPRIFVYGPDGSEVTSSSTTSGSNIADYRFAAKATGNFIVMVGDGSTYANLTGAYNLHFVRAPGTTEFGAPVNGGQDIPGTLSMGDLASFAFEAKAGEGIMVRVGRVSASLVPRIYIYGPTGAEVTATSTAGRVSDFVFSAPTTGTYTLVIGDGSTYMDGTGDYNLHFVRAPGAGEFGVPTNGGQAIAGTLSLGDLSSYAFTAKAGEGIMVRVGSVSTTLVPRIYIYGPTGAQITGTSTASRVSDFAFSAPTDGTYTLVIGDGSTYMDGTGDYNLYFVRAPGANEGGSLNDAVAHAAQIDLGDLDSFTISANAADKVQVTASATVAGSPKLKLYVFDTAGALLPGSSNSCSSSGSVLNFTAQLAGTYTVVAADCTTYFTGTGTYTIKATGATGTPVASDGSGDVPIPPWALVTLGVGMLGVMAIRQKSMAP